MRSPASSHSSTCAFVVVVAAAALASPAAHARNGGIYLELAPAWGFFLTDEVIIENGDDASSPYPQAGFTPALKAGVNLFGFVGGEMNITAHGWDLGNVNRGGGGFVGGVVRATPLEIFRFVIPDSLQLSSLIPEGPVTWHDRPFDVGVYMGGGYTLVGEDYAYQGGYFHWGVDLKLFITPYFAIGLDLPFRHALYEPFRYADYEDSLGYCTDGAKAFGVGGIEVGAIGERTPERQALELSAENMSSECDQPAPQAILFSPSLTITGMFDFGI